MSDPRRAISRSAILILLCAFVVAGQTARQQVRVPFTRTEAMITMRDGVRLHTVILTPQTQTEPLPILIDRTPYGVDDLTSDQVNGAYKEFVADGYIFVFHDIRGKFGSEGQFVMVRPPHGNDYAFLKGHRIMVQVQSSWFPLYDHNPQKFVPNIFLAQESDFQPATQRIYRSPRYPSHVSVSVADGG